VPAPEATPANAAPAEPKPKTTAFDRLTGGVCSNWMETPPDEDVKERADGREGRGLSPGCFEPVDAARYAAYLLTLQGETAQVKQAFARLLTDFDSEDWAYQTGFASCWAKEQVRAVCAVLDAPASDAAGLGVLLGPFAAVDAALSGATPTEGAAITGVAGVDALLLRGLSSPSTARRGVLLALLQLLSVRLELTQRLRTPALYAALFAGQAAEVFAAAADVASRHKAAFDAAFAGAAAQLARVMGVYVRAVGHKACCFGDLLPFLPALLPPVPLPSAALAKGALASAVAAPTNLESYLLGFTDTEAQLLAMPFAPLAPAGSSSDAATAHPVLRWSFSIASSDSVVATPVAGLIAQLQDLRSAQRTDATFEADVEALIAKAREQALAAEAERAEQEKLAKLAIGSTAGAAKKGKGGGKAAATSKADSGADIPVDSDPHRVAEALAPASAILFTSEDTATLEALRGRVRRYTTAMQLLRYLGVLALKRPQNSAGVTEAELSTVVDELSTSWKHTLPLGTACAGGQREVQEGDDLVLLGTHMLWEMAFQRLLDTGALADENSRILEARQRLLEAVLFLEIARQSSEYNAQIRMALLRSYVWIGANASFAPHLTALRFRHIMYDTLGAPLTLAPLQRNVWAEMLQQVSISTSRFAVGANKEILDGAKLAVSSGNFSNAIDMIRMRRRVTGSATVALARSAQALLGFSVVCRTLSDAKGHLSRIASVGEPVDTFADASVEGLLALRDNDDRDIHCSWDAPGALRLLELRFGIMLTSAVGSRIAAVDAAKVASGCIVGEAIVSDLRVLFETEKELYNTIPSLLAGCNGGTLERGLRRALKELTLSARQTAQASLLHALEGRTAQAKASLARLESILALTTGCGGAASDVFTASIPLVDTGLTQEQHKTSSLCMDVLVSAIKACVSASELIPSTNETDSEKALAEVTACAAKVYDGLGEFASLVMNSRFLPQEGVETAQWTASASGATSAPVAAKGKGKTKVALIRAPLRPAAIPEAFRLLFHIMPLLAIASGTISTYLSPAKAKAPASKGKSAPAKAAAVGSLSTTSSAKAEEVSKEFRAKLLEISQTFHDEFATLAGSLDDNFDKVEVSVTGGFDTELCASDFVKQLLLKRKADKEAKKAGGAASKKPAPIASTNAGEKYVMEASSSRSKSLAQALDSALTGLGASYQDSLTRVKAEAETRMDFLRCLATSR
jgi:hypothetical protein